MKDKLQRILNESTDEKPVAAFLAQHPELLGATFRQGWNYINVFHEFSLSRLYFVDFLVVSIYSGTFEVAFIELESPQAPLYIKDGNASRELRNAERQIREWRSWYSNPTNQSAFRQDLAERNRTTDKPYVWDELNNPQWIILPTWHIIIGRRQSLDRSDMGRKANTRDYRIITYDHLIDVAKAGHLG